MQVVGVEGAQAAAVGDADEGETGQVGEQALVQGLFGGFVQGAGGFVEEEPVGAVQPDAGKEQALLLAGGELARPVGVFVQAGGEGGQAGPMQGGAVLGFVKGAGAGGVGQAFAQAGSGGQVAVLGGEVQARGGGGQGDVALAVAP